MQLIASNSITLPVDKAVYLVHGGEPLQTIETTALIRNQLKSLGYIGRKVIELNNNVTIAQFQECTQNFDLFASKQVVEICLKEDNLGVQSAKNLGQYLENIPADLRVLIIANKLTSNAQKSKWFTLVKQKGCIIVAKAIVAEHFAAWIMARLKLYKLTANIEVISLLKRLYFGNLVALGQLIEKLAISFAGQELTVMQITPYLQDNTDFSVFNLMDAVISGDSAIIGQIITRLQVIKVEPIIVLWAIAREVRLLIKVAFALEQGQPYAVVAKTYGIWANKIGKTQKYLQQTSRAQLENILQNLMKIDSIIKGVEPGLIWESLVTVILQLVNIKTAGNFNIFPI